MWQTPAIFTACILLGMVCDVSQVCVQAEIIYRKCPDDATKLEEEICRLIDQIHDLSMEYKTTDASPTSAIYPNSEDTMDPTSRISALSMLERFDFGAYYGVLSGLFAVYKPLLKERVIDNLPRTLVCILSGREDCGLEAELTKTVVLDFGKPLLTLLSSLTSQTCTRPTAGSEAGETPSFLRSYLRMEESTISELNIFQEMFLTTLSHLPLSGNLMSAWRSFVDMTVSYFSTFMVTLLQTPVDFVKIALQFGIEVPSLDQSEHCHQGDLKQLLMWGMNHNVSWSFGNSILDIFLAPQQSLCSYPGPECQSPHSGPFSRTSEGLKDDDNKNILLKCDRHNLASLNDTVCADIITMSSREGSFSPSVFTFCQALSSLTPTQLKQVWSNTCHVIQALGSPVFSRSSDCSVWGTQPPPAVLPSSEKPPPPRLARAALSLNQLLCNYGNWSGGGMVDAGLVTLCSDNDREEFVKRVCNNAALMKKLLSDHKNNWLWGYCTNASADTAYMVSQFCRYESWMAHPTELVDSSLVAFCWNLDSDRLKRLICESVGLFTILFSNPENVWLMPNCTEVPPPPDFNLDSLVAESCRYSQWHDLMMISMDMISLCIRLDPHGFTTVVCANTTFLNELLRNNANAWLAEHCTISLSSPPTEPPLFFSIPDWCDYQTWAEKLVDPSVVGLCWQHDQLAFQKNVCCNMPLFLKLTLEPQNEWLMSVCTNKETTEIMPQVCRYSEWTRPVIVDMTDLALCAELDPLNFTCNVCSNTTVLQNLLANLDNTWLLQHCANHSSPVATALCGGGTGGDGLMGFKPTEQCQYSSWNIGLPDAALLALCWDYDLANFVSSVCPDAGLLSLLAREPSSVWVSTLCATYTNHSTTSNVNNSTTETQPCLARDLVRKFNWSCSADFTSVCRPGASQIQALQVMLRCWVETLRPRVEGLLTQRIVSMVDQAVSITVVIMVALEESQMTTLHVTENIRLSVLESVVLYLEREVNFDNKRILLQCFGKVLTSLMQTGRDVTNDGFFLIKEYFRIPMGSLRPVLRAVDITTVRQILHYYGRNKDTLQLTGEYMSTMVSVLFQTHLARDKTLFPDLAPLLALASPADIQALPSLQASLIVREVINSNLLLMSLEQRRAFGRWYGKAVGPLNMTRGSASLIRDTGNLIVYLPFHSFQHLAPAQLLKGLDVLERNSLSSLKQQFVADSLIGTYRNMTAQDFTRLGNLSCLADPEKLQVYRHSEAFSVIQDSIRTCVRQGLSLPSHMISTWLLNSELQPPSSLPASQVAELAHLLPLLGLDFLQDLSQSQLSPALPALASVSFTPIQAGIIVEKMFPSNTLGSPGRLQTLGSLIRGVKVETLWALTADILLASLPTMALHTPGLSPPQSNAIASKLWGSPDVVSWLDKVQPLLSTTPLLSLLPRTGLLLANNSTYRQAWNTQQAKAIFKELMNTTPWLSKEDFLTLGTVGQGVSCKVLHQLFQAQPSSSSVRSILAFLREQSGPLHTSLKKCVVEELYQFEFFSELLGELGAQIALALPVSSIKKFPADMMETLRGMIVKDPHHFLLLPRTKQELLVDKMVQRMGMYTGEYTEEEFRSLGIMATFVVDEVFMQLERSFFVDNLDFLRGLCYSAGKRDMVARILQEIFGPIQDWTSVIINQVDRFLFFLPKDKLLEINLDLMTLGRIERLFLSQRQWELGDVGVHCMRGRDQDERRGLFDKQQFVLQYFLGFLTVDRLSSPILIPSCEMLHTTVPSAWTIDSLTGMSSAAFSSCLELMGQDLFFTPYQRTLLLKKAKEVYGPVSSFSPSVIAQLGVLALQLTEEELGSLRLTEISSISAMGAISTWSNRQLAVLFSTVLNSTKRIPSELDSSTLVAMGHIVCGAKAIVMRNLNAVEFSKAVLWLGRLRLSCSEEQLLVLVGLLTHSLAFGPASSWGADVFIEIGALAAGLPDMAMSALVKEQIEGITPRAISLIPPEKFAVVFDQSQINMFSYEQAVSVTADQRSALSPVQQTALAMVLTPWEDRPVDFRGRSSGLALSPSPLCHLLGLLMLLILLPFPAVPWQMTSFTPAGPGIISSTT